MSQENVELARSALDAFNRRDKAAWLALSDAAVENIPPSDWPESGRVQGPERVWDFLVAAQDVWGDESAPFEYVEIFDVGSDKVAADLRRDVRGKSSGASVVFSYWQVGTFRNGKMVRLEWFGSRGEALEAARAAG